MNEELRKSRVRCGRFRVRLRELVFQSIKEEGITLTEVAIVMNEDIRMTLTALNENALNPENKLS